MVDLGRYGIRDRFPRLVELERVAGELESARLQAEQEVASARQAVEVAREEDMAAAADALRAGKKLPSDLGKREARAASVVEASERTLAAYSRAAEAARHDVAAAFAEHRGEIAEAVLEAVREASRRARENATALVADYALIEDSRYDLRSLAPPTPPAETGPPGTDRGRDSMTVIGIQTRQSIGPARGDVEGMLAYLASLEAQFAEPDSKEADVA